MDKTEKNDIKLKALKLCQEYIGLSWLKVDASNFKFSAVSGGLSNTLYLCSLPDHIETKSSKTPRQVLLRLYGVLQDDEHVVVTETTTFTLLSEKGLGPKLYGVFPNGRLEEFIPSRSINSDDIKRLSTSIAREMAKIHALEVPVSKVPDLWTRHMKRWLQDVEKDSLRVHNKSFPFLDFYREEIDWGTKEMEKIQSPIVYCHNDLQGGNILLRDDSSNADSEIILIDFEFGGYNYRTYDIANHFCEWIFDYNLPEPPHFVLNIDKYPTREEKVDYIRAYLDQLVLEGTIKADSVDAEIEKILQELKILTMMPHLYWALWSEKMKFLSPYGFSHKEHGKKRMELYQWLKKNYLKEKKGLVNGS